MERIAKKLEFWTLIGPLLIVVTLLAMLIHGAKGQLGLSLFAVLGVLLCWKWSVRGLVVAIGCLAIISSYYLGVLPDERAWVIVASLSIGTAFFVTALSMEEAEQIIQEIENASSGNLEVIAEQLKEAQGEREALHGKIQLLEKNHETKLIELEKSKEILLSEKTQLIQEIFGKSHEIVSLQENFQKEKLQIEDQVKSLKKCLHEQNEIIFANHQSIQKAQEAQRILERNIEQLTREKSQFAMRNEELAREVNEFKKLEKEVQLITEDKEELQRRTEGIIEEKRGLERSLEQVAEEKRGLERRVEQVIEEKRELERWFEQMTEEKAEFQRRFEQIAEEKEELQRRAVEIEDEKRTFEQMAEEKEGLQKRTEQEKAEMQMRVEQLICELQRTTAEIESITNEKNSLEKRFIYRQPEGRAGAMYLQLREQFEEKSLILEATRQELFHTQEKLLKLQKEVDESLLTGTVFELELQEFIKEMDGELTYQEREHQDEIVRLENLISHVLN